MFTHEDLLKEALAKIQVQLNLAKQAEKEKKPEEDGATQAETNSEKPKVDEKVPEPNSSKKGTEGKPHQSFVNGIEPEQKKFVNGDTTDNDSTAVNTGSTTPLTKDKEPGTPSDSDPTTDEPKETEDPGSLVPTVQSLSQQVLHLQKLVDFLHDEFGPTRQKLNDLLENNDIKFGLLWCLFRLGSVITFKDHESGLNMAGEVPTTSAQPLHLRILTLEITSAEYMRRGDQQEYFEIHVRYIDYNGSTFYYSWQRL